MTNKITPVTFLFAQGETISEMRINFLNTVEGAKMYNDGDVKLVWVSEGDLSTNMIQVMMHNQALDQGD
jgi:hypothetical protein